MHSLELSRLMRHCYSAVSASYAMNVVFLPLICTLVINFSTLYLNDTCTSLVNVIQGQSYRNQTMEETREDTSEERPLTQLLLSTARAMTELQSSLEREYIRSDMEIDTFYETQFKRNNLIDIVLDLYTDMYSSIKPEEWPKITDKNETNEVITEEKANEIDAIRVLQMTEKNWDHFMKEIDICMKKKWQESEKEYVDVIDIGFHCITYRLGHVEVTDCESDKLVALRDVLSTKYGRCALFVLIRYYGCPVCFAHVRALVDRAKEFETKCANIIIVCKGTKEGGSKWKQLTGVTFPVLADERSEFVRSLHFGASVWDLCNMAVFHWRAKVRAAGDTEYRGYVEDKLHDFYQLGGDVIVDTKGRLISVYKSKATTDRPSVDELLKLIPNLDQQNRKQSAEVQREQSNKDRRKCGCGNRKCGCRCCSVM